MNVRTCVLGLIIGIMSIMLIVYSHPYSRGERGLIVQYVGEELIVYPYEIEGLIFSIVGLSAFVYGVINKSNKKPSRLTLLTVGILGTVVYAFIILFFLWISNHPLIPASF